MDGYVVRELMRLPDLTVADANGTFGRRIVIPEIDLTITVFGGEILVHSGYKKTNQTIMLKERVEVPERVVKAAQIFEQNQKALLDLDYELNKLTSLS